MVSQILSSCFFLIGGHLRYQRFYKKLVENYNFHYPSVKVPKIKTVKSCFLLIISFTVCACVSPGGSADSYLADKIAPFRTVTERENLVYNYENPGNGSYPMWAYGNSSIVRFNNTLVVCGMEKLQGVEGYNNTRWTLFGLQDDNWMLVTSDQSGHTREPSPLGIFKDGRMFLSANPTLDKQDKVWPLSSPELLQFDIDNPEKQPVIIEPQWAGKQSFNHHSYRTLSVDGPNNSFILFQHNTASQLQWAYFEGNAWRNAGYLKWPRGETYEVPQDIRICYPVVQLKNRKVHFFGVSDIIEPNKAWKDYKYALSGSKLDYDFRRLFYTSSNDITTGSFTEWTEIASREETAGNLTPCDLWIDPADRVHLLWWEKALDERLQKIFFPEARQSVALKYAVVKDGRKIFEKAIVTYDEKNRRISPYKGRFHITPDNRLYVIYYADENNVGSIRILQISPGFDFGPSQKIDLKVPLWIFSTAGLRNGCEPSWYIDLLGDQDGNKIRYARIKIITL